MNAYRTFITSLLTALVIANATQAATVTAASTALISTTFGCDQIEAYPMIDGVTDTTSRIPLLEARDTGLTGFATGPDGQQFAYLTNATRKSITTWWVQAGSQPVTAALVGGTKGENTYLYNDATQLGVTTDSGLVANGKLTQVAFCYEPDMANASNVSAASSVLSAATTVDSLALDSNLTLTATAVRCVCRFTSTGTRICLPAGCLK